METTNIFMNIFFLMHSALTNLFLLLQEYAGKSGEKVTAMIPKENLSVNSGDFQNCTISKESYRAYENDELKGSRQAAVKKTDVLRAHDGRMETMTVHKVQHVKCFCSINCTI